MKERPILFSSSMVRAILEGRKSQTRRIVKPQPTTTFIGMVCDHAVFQPTDSSGGQISAPHGKQGDRLWVREAYWKWGKWAPNGTTKTGRKKFRFVPVGQSIRYCADGNKPSVTAKRDGECGWVYRHARYMPKADSRITREITDVRVQRLQDASAVDCIDEGVLSLSDEWIHEWFPLYAEMYAEWLQCTETTAPPLGPGPWHRFKALWQSIHGEGAWESNPFVWAYTFKQVTA